jgi:putative exosortase-associated protein (TIGR04073 family)
MVKKFVVFTLLCLWCASSYAMDENAVTKLARGITNQATCWIEVPKQIYLVSKERDPFTGVIFGAPKGVCETLIRASSGIYDTSLFLLPPYDKPLTEYEFVFEGWDE